MVWLNIGGLLPLRIFGTPLSEIFLYFGCLDNSPQNRRT